MKSSTWNYSAWINASEALLRLAVVVVVFCALSAGTCPNSCACNSDLKKVDCSNASLSTVPGDIEESTEELILQFNSISSAKEDDFSQLQQLKWLDLRSNIISSLHAKTFRDLKKIERIRLNNNLLNRLPRYIFEGLDNLRLIDLSNNHLQSLRARTFPLNVTWLDLTNNNLTTFSLANFVDGLAKNLQYLFLSNNQLTAVPRVCARGSQLERIYLGNNRIAALGDPRLFLNCSKYLSQIYLSDNRLTEIPAEVFSGLGRLERLYLDGNRIFSIHHNAFDGSFNSSRRGVWLKIGLSDNQLTGVPSALGVPLALSAENEALLTLDLSANLLYKVDSAEVGILDVKSSRFFVNLEDNEWACNCQVQSMKVLLQTRPTILETGSRMICSSPHFLRGRNLLSVDVDDLRCEKPSVNAINSLTTVIEGKNARLNCQTTAEPEATLTWTTPHGVKIFSTMITDDDNDNDNREKLQISGSDLIIKNANLRDAGSYTCNASNFLGWASGHAELLVVTFSIDRPNESPTKQPEVAPSTDYDSLYGGEPSSGNLEWNGLLILVIVAAGSALGTLLLTFLVVCVVSRCKTPERHNNEHPSASNNTTRIVDNNEYEAIDLHVKDNIFVGNNIEQHNFITNV